MSFLLKLLGAWFLVSVPVAVLLGRILRHGDRRAATSRARSGAVSQPEAGSQGRRAAS
jgi:hypothetical protein